MAEDAPSLIHLRCQDACVSVLPAAGVVVSAFSIGSKQILAPDGMADFGGKKKRRGGIPILFPHAGALKQSAPGFQLAQHGFARDLPWETTRMSITRTDAEFRLRSDDATRAKYPFDFELHVNIKLEASALDYTLAVRNLSGTPLFAAPGLHPYFSIPSNRNLLRTNVPGFQIETYRMDESLILPLQRVELEVPDLGRVSMIPGEGFLRPQAKLVVWSDRPDYMCFEPWAAGVGSLFLPGERVEVAPKGEARFSMRIEVKPSGH